MLYTAEPPLRVVIADDSEVACSSLRNLLEDLPGVVLVGEARSGPAVVELCARVNPAIVLLDIRMPGLNGIQVTTILRREQPDVRVIILTMFAHHRFLVEAVRAGAQGYLLKDLDRGELLLALHTVATGGIYLSPEIAGEAMRHELGCLAGPALHSS